jgi:NADH-quinone oxidoreductase subunit L
LIIAAFLTAFYIFRQIFMVFFGEPRSEPTRHSTESKAIITIPLIILAVLSFVGGWINFPTIHSFTTWLGHTLTGLAEGSAGAEAETVGFSMVIAITSTVIALAGISLAWYLYHRRVRDMQKLPINQRPDDPLRSILGPVFTALENKYWVDEFYGLIIVRPYQWLSKFLAEKVDWDFWHDFVHDRILAAGYKGLTRILAGPIDLGIIDGIANFLGDGFKELAAQMRKLQSGFVRNYALSIFIGVIFIVGYLILRLR